MQDCLTYFSQPLNCLAPRILAPLNLKNSSSQPFVNPVPKPDPPEPIRWHWLVNIGIMILQHGPLF